MHLQLPQPYLPLPNLKSLLFLLPFLLKKFSEQTYSSASMGEWFPYLKKRQLVFISGLQGERPTHNAPKCIEEYPYSEEGETDATGVDEKCGSEEAWSKV